MSANMSYAHRYREIAIKTANPLQLVIMLYDAAICSLQEARSHIEHKNIAGRSKSINQCIAIVSELQACLDLKAGGDIASSLDRLYDYMKRRIFRANVEQSTQPLSEIETLLESLRDAWRELIAQNPGAVAQASGQVMPNPGIIGSAPSSPSAGTKSLNISI
jgi:flagellar protein FliS